MALTEASTASQGQQREDTPEAAQGQNFPKCQSKGARATELKGVEKEGREGGEERKEEERKEGKRREEGREGGRKGGKELQ